MFDDRVLPQALLGVLCHSWCMHHITFLKAEKYIWPQGHTCVCTYKHPLTQTHVRAHAATWLHTLKRIPAHRRSPEHPQSPRHRSTHTGIRHTHRPQHLLRRPLPLGSMTASLSHHLPQQGGRGVLTMGALQLGHGGHEGALGHVALHRGHERLLVGRVQRLRELDGLQGSQAAAHAVDDRHALCLCGGQAWSGRGRSQPDLLPPPWPPQAQP